MKNSPLIKCPTCAGEGTVQLNAELAETLAIFKRSDRLTSQDVKSNVKSDVTQNAITNRLEKLRAQGLLERVRVGKWFQYFLPKKTKG